MVLEQAQVPPRIWGLCCTKGFVFRTYLRLARGRRDFLAFRPEHHGTVPAKQRAAFLCGNTAKQPTADASTNCDRGARYGGLRVYVESSTRRHTASNDLIDSAERAGRRAVDCDERCRERTTFLAVTRAVEYVLSQSSDHESRRTGLLRALKYAAISCNGSCQRSIVAKL
jgi:hypothetical protein